MNIDLHYEESGNGYPLIFLHGNGGNTTYFKHQIPFFNEKYKVIAIDTRGHGQSPRGTAPFTIAQCVEDLKKFMDNKGIKKSHIFGFSDGGNIAMLFAIKYPAYVD